MEQDTNLKGNDLIEEAIKLLQQQPSEEALAYALTVVRRRLKEDGHFIISVSGGEVMGNLGLNTVNTDDGKEWFVAFTSFDEQLKGSNAVMSGFTSPIRKLFDMALKTDGVEGIIINPWNRTLMLDKSLIKLILAQ